jgi:Uma2 family endonuclease
MGKMSMTIEGSFNHSLLQAKLASLFFSLRRFKAAIKLSLDVSQLGELSQFQIKATEALEPDVCVYPNTITPDYDILKMSEMPLLAIEILSPRQSLEELLDKFKVYFALGIKSCWLVIPPLESVTVYSSDNMSKSFAMPLCQEVFDEILDVKIPLMEIFVK